MKFLKILFFILFLNSSLTTYANEIKLAPKEIIDDYLEMADNYAFAGNYQKALEYIDMVVYFEPMNTTARYKQALLLTTLNKTDEARKIFAQALKLNPKFANSELASMLKEDKNEDIEPMAKLELIPIPQQTKNSSKNIFTPEDTTESEIVNPLPKLSEYEPKQPIITEKTKTIEPYSSEYYNQLGLQYLNDGDNKQAYEYFLKAIELDKKNYLAYNNLGLFYWQQGENKLAEEQFKKAIKIDSQAPKALLNIGLLYKEQEKENKYYDYIHRALNCNPNDYLSNWVVGNYYMDTGKYTQAIKLYKKAIEQNQEFYEAYISLGNAFAATQKFEKAYAVFKKALNINSVDPNLYYILSRTASAIEKHLDAKEFILQAINLTQNDKFYLELAKVTSNMGDYEESLDILMKYFSETQEPEILNYIGLAYYKIKQPEIALTYFKKLVELDKSKTIYYYNLALCYKSLGDRNKFFKYVDMATKILPKYPQDYIDLSYVYYDNGNKSYALNILNDGITKYPNNKKLYSSKLSLFETSGDTKNYVEFKSIVDSKFQE